MRSSLKIRMGNSVTSDFNLVNNIPDSSGAGSSSGY